MKKFIILLLAALMLLAVSCKKDKSEEMIANYLEFKKNYKAGMTAYPGDLAKGDGKLEAKEIGTDYLEDILTALDSESKVNVTAISDESTGYWQSVEISAGYGADLNDIVIKYTYTEGESTEEKNGELSISGNIRIENGETQKITCTVKINNKDYNFSLSGSTATGKYISATANGKDVEVRLLNSNPSIY